MIACRIHYATVLLVASVSCASAQALSHDFTTTPGVSLSVTANQSLVQPQNRRATGLPLHLTADLPATTVTGTIPFDPATMMRTADLRPGQKGYGLTVFSGIRPEKFDATVVGVRHKAFAGDDMILAQLRHPILDEIGVVAGMSGSPVYVDGKLIGAVAYGWQFQKEALAGITSIEAMLRVYNATQPGDVPEEEGAASGSMQAYNTFMQMRADGQVRSIFQSTESAQPANVQFSRADFPAASDVGLQLPDSFSMTRLSTPFYVSASSPRTMNFLRTAIAGLNIEPMAVGGVASSPSQNALNSPGGPVGDLAKLADEVSGGWGLAVPMCEGDLSAAGVGTVSFRQGNKLVAFGHPMFEFGRVAMPMAPARINAVVRNAIRPFKLGESLGQIGVIRQDRLPAIGAVFGEQARMFDLHATVIDDTYASQRDFKMRITADRFMGPNIAMTALFESLSAASKSGNATAALYNYTVAFDDGTTISREDYVVDIAGGSSSVIGIGSDLGILLNNPFKPVRPVSVRYTSRLAQRLPQANILAVALDKDAYRPGESAELSILVQPYRKDAVTIKYTVPIPANLEDGTYMINVGDASARQSMEIMRNPGVMKINDYDSLIRFLQQNYPRNRIYVSMQDRDNGINVRGAEMPRLPSSVVATLEQAIEPIQRDPIQGNYLHDGDLTSEFEVTGSQQVPLVVKRINP